MKVLVATEKAFAPSAITMIREVVESAGHQLALLENYGSTGDLLSAVTDADALIVRSDIVTPAVIEAAVKLRIVVRAGAGYDNIDLAACTVRKIVAMNTPGQNSNAVAELAFALMLYDARGGFAGTAGTELRGKNLGLHAFGNIARYMAIISKGFGMNVFAFDPFVTVDDFERNGVKQCKDVNELYSSCQYVSLHLPSNEKTNKSVGYDLLKLMPHKSVLVNTARKEIIDEEGLLKIFGERPLFRYLADVEPDSREIFESKHKGRFIFTAKKMGAQTEEANINAGIAAARQVVDYFATGNEKFRVNK